MATKDIITKSNPAEQPVERVLVITRIFDASCDFLFKAWSDPKHMAKWWGPKGFTNPVCEMDVRPGGALRIVMRAPDGVEHPMTGVFREIVKPERLVFTAVARDKEGNPLLEALTTVTFAEHGGKTRLTLQASTLGIAPIAAQMLEGMEAGWTQSLEKLSDVVANTADREIVMTRVFDYPRELVFKAWTDPKHVPQWWGPRGFTTATHGMDVRPGGVWRFVMHGPDGTDYDNKIVYMETVKPSGWFTPMAQTKRTIPSNSR